LNLLTDYSADAKRQVKKFALQLKLLVSISSTRMAEAQACACEIVNGRSARLTIAEGSIIIIIIPSPIHLPTYP